MNRYSARYKNVFFSSDEPDNFFTVGSKVFKVNFFFEEDNDVFINCNEVVQLKNYFDIPILSSLLYIQYNESLSTDKEASVHNFEQINKKLVCLNSGSELVFIPFVYSKKNGPI